ncbi:MAG: hypothetical protein ACKVOK_00985 [Flavobacteriales bacterium]
MKKNYTYVFGLVMLLCIGFVINGCKKDKETIATITIVNDDGAVVPGATVRLFSNPSEFPPPPNALRFDTTQVTNGTGKVTFDFTEFYKKGQAGFAVLDIEAYKGGLNGEGIIKIEEETTSEETITIE